MPGLLKSGLGQFAVVWDEEEKRGRAYAQQFGADYTSSLEEALAREDVDAVMVECPTTRHREVIVAAARAGKHIFTDKALALTQEDSQAIREAVEAAGVKLAVSMEAKSTAPYRYLRQLIQEGKLGRVTSGYFRRAHGAALDPNMLRPIGLINPRPAAASPWIWAVTGCICSPGSAGSRCG